MLLAVGQDMNSQGSHVAKGTRITMDMHMVISVGARTFITSAQGCNALRLHAAAAGTVQNPCCENRESSKTGHETDESSDNHALQ